MLTFLAAAYSSPSPSPLQNSNGRPVTHPTYGHDAKVESGAWVEEYYDDEDEEGDEYEYDDAGLEDDEDYYILGTSCFCSIGHQRLARRDLHGRVAVGRSTMG